ncbi:MAG: hypothetical protein ACRAVC_26465 [Trichormus sp.]
MGQGAGGRGERQGRQGRQGRTFTPMPNAQSKQFIFRSCLISKRQHRYVYLNFSEKI